MLMLVHHSDSVRTVKWFVVFAVVFLAATHACALEPVTALEDGFAVPFAGGTIESVLFYPGAESFTVNSFACLAWCLPYGMENLGVSTVHCGMNFGKMGVSCAFTASGFELYGEDMEKLGVSYAPLKHFAVGARITRNAMRIKGFGQADAVSADVGAIVRPVEKVFLAVSCEDVLGVELGESREPLDGAVRCAATWKLSDRFTFLSSLRKVRRFEPSFSTGFTAAIGDVLTAGVLGGNEPDRFEFLISALVARIRCSYRGSYHQDLGMTHGFSLTWGYAR